MGLQCLIIACISLIPLSMDGGFTHHSKGRLIRRSISARPALGQKTQISQCGKPAKRKIFLYIHFRKRENEDVMETAFALEQEVIRSLQEQKPFSQLPGVEAVNVTGSEGLPFDVRFELRSGEARVLVFGEVKSGFTPKQLAELKPWLQRLQSTRNDAVFVIIAPALSIPAQNYCLESGINFIDLIGNLSINVPGQFILQRTGIRDENRKSIDAPPSREANVFSGRFSRVVRVLLQQPRTWTLTEIATELDQQSNANPIISEVVSGELTETDFRISLGSISKALASLEEQLLVRRRNSAVLVPEPERLLKVWAAKYRERYRWRLRQSFRLKKPLGKKLNVITGLLRKADIRPFVVTGSAAASLRAPFVDVETIDIFVPDLRVARPKTELLPLATEGPEICLMEPYDFGVFLYASIEDGIPVVSNIQAYLDLYARGGRDQKQATYLLENVIEPRWKE